MINRLGKTIAVVFLMTTLSAFTAQGLNQKSRIIYGTENSGGGGSAVIAPKTQIESTVNDFFTFLKAGEKFRVAHFFYGPYSRVLANLTAEEQIIRGDSLKTLIDLDNQTNRLSEQQRSFLITFVNVFSTPASAFMPDFFSFMEKFDYENLKRSLAKTNLIFANCALKHKLPQHKLASFFVDRQTQQGEFCFDSEKLSHLGPLNIEIQISALFAHELTHMYHELSQLPKAENNLEVENSAEAMQVEFFNYYSEIQKIGYESNTIKTIITEILMNSTKSCINDFSLQSSFIETQFLALLLASYAVPITAYTNKDSVEFELFEISKFLGHFHMFRNKQANIQVEQLKKTYCVIDMQKIVFNDYLTTFLQAKLKRLNLLEAQAKEN